MVKFLLAVDTDYFEGLFATNDFRNICELVINKAGRKDCRELEQLKRFANKCLRRHKTAIRNLNDAGFNDPITLEMIMDTFYKDVREMMQDPFFQTLCLTAICKSKEPQQVKFADLMLDVSEMLGNLNRETKQETTE